MTASLNAVPGLGRNAVHVEAAVENIVVDQIRIE